MMAPFFEQEKLLGAAPGSKPGFPSDAAVFLSHVAPYGRETVT
jgi:hypothetical protein